MNESFIRARLVVAAVIFAVSKEKFSSCHLYQLEIHVDELVEMRLKVNL